jgi:hypothetical protein
MAYPARPLVDSQADSYNPLLDRSPRPPRAFSVLETSTARFPQQIADCSWYQGKT